ncbi:unnamed protein product [Vicia faba]|uniref:DUF3444 domain-containing protein n=1 Tax=Vicia faba TaxID=3906 RepID=A0AAV0YK28_VICFA|nr:unnamed protein product [Vicia faba]
MNHQRKYNSVNLRPFDDVVILIDVLECIHDHFPRLISQSMLDFMKFGIYVFGTLLVRSDFWVWFLVLLMLDSSSSGTKGGRRKSYGGVLHVYINMKNKVECGGSKGVTPLVKFPGFRTVFRRQQDQNEVKRIPKEEMFRFSHQVPNHLLSGQEAHNAPIGCRELDPTATPLDLLQIETEAYDTAGERMLRNLVEQKCSNEDMLFLDFIWMSILMVNTVITSIFKQDDYTVVWDYYMLSVPDFNSLATPAVIAEVKYSAASLAAQSLLLRLRIHSDLSRLQGRNMSWK